MRDLAKRGSFFKIRTHFVHNSIIDKYPKLLYNKYEVKTMKEITAYAYIPSVEEFDECWRKFPAFLGKRLSEKAEAQGAYANDEEFEGKGYYPLRNFCPISSTLLCFGGHYAARDWDDCNTTEAGLCVALQVVYDPTKDYAQSAKATQTSVIYDFGEPLNTRSDVQERAEESTADIIKFGGKFYIWTNKAECESGQDVTMKLIGVFLEERVTVLDNDFGSDTSKPLRDQCHDVATEGCTDEERKMIVKMKFDDEDGYALGMSIFTPVQAEVIKDVRKKLRFPEVKINVEAEPIC